MFGFFRKICAAAIIKLSLRTYPEGDKTHKRFLKNKLLLHRNPAGRHSLTLGRNRAKV